MLDQQLRPAQRHSRSAPRRYSGRLNRHFTTRLTALPGTTITFATVLPSAREHTCIGQGRGFNRLGIGIGRNPHDNHELAHARNRFIGLVEHMKRETLNLFGHSGWMPAQRQRFWRDFELPIDGEAFLKEISG